MSAATKIGRLYNLHVPLPDELHGELRQEALRTGRPATSLVREALETWLAERRRAALHDAIASYAARWGGSELDLDADLERASVEHLRGPVRSPRPRKTR